jgi:hypothetical protein
MVVDPKGESDGVATKRTKFVDLARFRPPYNGFEVENLRGRAVCVLSLILRNPDFLASIVANKQRKVECYNGKIF